MTSERRICSQRVLISCLLVTHHTATTLLLHCHHTTMHPRADGKLCVVGELKNTSPTRYVSLICATPQQLRRRYGNPAEYVRWCLDGKISKTPHHSEVEWYEGVEFPELEDIGLPGDARVEEDSVEGMRLRNRAHKKTIGAIWSTITGQPDRFNFRDIDPWSKYISPVRPEPVRRHRRKSLADETRYLPYQMIHLSARHYQPLLGGKVLVLPGADTKAGRSCNRLEFLPLGSSTRPSLEVESGTTIHEPSS